MAIRDGVGWVAHIAGAGHSGRAAETKQACALKVQTGWPGFGGRKMCVALPGVRSGLKACRVLEVEARRICARCILEVVGEKLCLDLGAELFADGLTVVEVAQAARGRGPIAVAPGAEDEEVLVVLVV